MGDDWTILDDCIAVLYVMRTCRPILRLLLRLQGVAVVLSLSPSLFDPGDM